jgi:hypothetical protein
VSEIEREKEAGELTYLHGRWVLLNVRQRPSASAQGLPQRLRGRQPWRRGPEDRRYQTFCTTMRIVLVSSFRVFCKDLHYAHVPSASRSNHLCTASVARHVLNTSQQPSLRRSDADASGTRLSHPTLTRS